VCPQEPQLFRRAAISGGLLQGDHGLAKELVETAVLATGLVPQLEDVSFHVRLLEAQPHEGVRQASSLVRQRSGLWDDDLGKLVFVVADGVVRDGAFVGIDPLHGLVRHGPIYLHGGGLSTGIPLLKLLLLAGPTPCPKEERGDRHRVERSYLQKSECGVCVHIRRYVGDNSIYELSDIIIFELSKLFRSKLSPALEIRMEVKVKRK
jgi:hypothetical protein